MSGAKLVTLRIRYVTEDVDRHGNVRLYFRRKGRPKVRLHGAVGTPEFAEAYAKALAGDLPASAASPRPKAKPGSFRWACEQYFASADFKQLNLRTQRIRRIKLNDVCDAHGDNPISRLEAKHVRILRDERADTPEAANDLLKTLRQLLRFAAEMGYVAFNCARDVRYIRRHSDGFHTWTEAEILQFKTTHPPGSQARLALALLLNIGQRRSDVIQFGWQHVDGGKIRFRQVKNCARNPVELAIPIVPELREELATIPRTQLQFLITDFGKPFSADGFGNKLKRWCRQAGLPHCSSHGLRKACAVRLAEAGCSDHEIMAITGHRTLKEVSRYTRAADQVRLAERAIAKLQLVETANRSVPPFSTIEQSGTKPTPKSLKS